MAIQPKTFNPLPPKERILQAIERQRRHVQDPTSYIWYLMPLAERFGDEVYDVAAESLAESGLDVTAAELKDLARDLQNPEGRERCNHARLRHIGLGITSCKNVPR